MLTLLPLNSDLLRFYSRLQSFPLQPQKHHQGQPKTQPTKTLPFPNKMQHSHLTFPQNYTFGKARPNKTTEGSGACRAGLPKPAFPARIILCTCVMEKTSKSRKLEWTGVHYFCVPKCVRYSPLAILTTEQTTDDVIKQTLSEGI